MLSLRLAGLKLSQLKRSVCVCVCHGFLLEYGYCTMLCLYLCTAEWTSHVYTLCCAQSWPTVCCPMDCSPPDSSVLGIFQAGIRKWAAISCSRGSSPPRVQTCVSWISCNGRKILYLPGATPREPPCEHPLDFPELYGSFSLVICFIHTVYMSIPTSQFIQPTSISSLGVPRFILCLFLYFCFENKIIYTIFLDSTYMC